MPRCARAGCINSTLHFQTPSKTPELETDMTHLTHGTFAVLLIATSNCRVVSLERGAVDTEHLAVLATW